MQQLDNFQIEKLLGEGSFGQVYLTTRKGDSKKYATKKRIIIDQLGSILIKNLKKLLNIL